MFVQSQQALPVLQVQEWVLLWTPGSQLIAARLCRGSPLLFPGPATAFCDSQTLAPPASLAGFSAATGRRMLGDPGVISLLWSPFLLSDQKRPKGMCSAGVGVICLGSYLLEGVVLWQGEQEEMQQ